VNFVTDFADQAVLLPLALVVALCLGISGWWRGAAAWLVGVGATLTLMLVLKLAFIACGPDQILRSPSGHTAGAAVVFGGIMVVLGAPRRWAVPAAGLAALVIGGSRLVLDVHTPLEVMVGAAAGVGGAALIASMAGATPKFSRNRTAIAALIVIVIFHGMRMPAEAHIRGFAERVALYFPACQA
jgi:membrane-associated phospholipid phosphatase